MDIKEESTELDQLENDPVEETAVEQTDDSQVGNVEVEKEAAPEAPEVSEAPEKQERPIYHMPVAKAQAEKQKAVEKAREEARKEAEAEMQRLRDEYESKLQATAPETQTYKDELEKVATEHGLDPKAAESLLEVFKKAIPQQDLSKYDAILKEREQEAVRMGVSKEFEENVVPLIQQEFPGADAAHIAKVKQQIMDLAFTEGYNTYAIADIYRVKKEEFAFQNKMSAEPSGGRSSEMVGFTKLSDEDEIKLADSDPQAYANYVKWLDTQGTRFNY